MFKASSTLLGETNHQEVGFYDQQRGIWDKTTNVTHREVVYSRPKISVRNTSSHLYRTTKRFLGPRSIPGSHPLRHGARGTMPSTELRDLLAANGLEKYAAVFEEEGVDLQQLAALTVDDSVDYVTDKGAECWNILHAGGSAGAMGTRSKGIFAPRVTERSRRRRGVNFTVCLDGSDDPPL